MSVYNHERYVAAAISSVLAQSFADFEFIILNNGSTDRSSEIIKSFNDPRIVYLNEDENKTAYWGIETCFNHSCGKYIAFIGSDDVWDCSKLKEQFEFIEKNIEYGAIFTETKIIDESGKVLEWAPRPFLTAEKNMSRYGWLREFFFFSNSVCWPSCLMNRNLKPPSSWSDARFKQLGDLNLWINVLSKKNIYVYPQELTYYRQHGENESQKDFEFLYNRANLESYYLLDYYKKISTDELPEIFPELREVKVLNAGNKDFYLAKLAMERFPDTGNEKARKMFGLLTIFNMYSNKEMVDEVSLTNDFSLNDFYRLTGTGINLAHLGKSSLTEARFATLVFELVKRIKRISKRFFTMGIKNLAQRLKR